MRTGSIATIFVLALVFPAAANARQNQPPAQTPVPAAASTDRGGPLFLYGWSFSSIIRNGAVIMFMPAKPKQSKVVLWRGLQATGTIGNRGFEAGLGFGQYTIKQIPLGFDFRGLAGRTWKASGDLASEQWYAGGEVAATFAWFRATGGVVVPVGGDGSHPSIFTTSVGIVIPYWRQPKKAPKTTR